MSELTNIFRLLKVSGWNAVKPPNDRILIFESPHDADGDFASVVLPKNDSFADTPQRVNAALSTLAEYFKTPIENLATRLAIWDRDILRSRLFHRERHIDNIPLKLASLIIDDLRVFVGYAAYTQESPQRFFQKAGATAADFTAHCSFGHTFRGSFGLSIECPLPKVDQLTITEELKDPPFERLVMQRIARGYQALQNATASNDPSILVKSYEEGMNANMLHVLTDVYERLDTLSIEYSLEWSPELAPPADLKNSSATFRFDGNTYEIAKSAARSLEAEDAPQETVIVSHVVSLKSEMPLDDGEQDAFDHVITLDWQKEKYVLIRIRVALPREEYRKACDAHKTGRKIAVTGTPVKHGKFWVLTKPSEVTFVV